MLILMDLFILHIVIFLMVESNSSKIYVAVGRGKLKENELQIFEVLLTGIPAKQKNLGI